MREEMKDKPLNKWSRKDLLSLPSRRWDDTSKVYDSLLLISTRKKHDSGWAMIAIIGVNNNKPSEVLTECSDDLNWMIKGNQDKYFPSLRMDCCLTSGAMHFWIRSGKFRVGMALSSIDITLEDK